MNTISCSSYTSSGFNDLFSYTRNIKMLKNIDQLKKSQENVMKENKTSKRLISGNLQLLETDSGTFTSTVSKASLKYYLSAQSHSALYGHLPHQKSKLF